MVSQIPTARIKLRTDSCFISIPNFKSEIVLKNVNTKSWIKDSFDASELVVAETKSKFIFKVLLLQINPQFFAWAAKIVINLVSILVQILDFEVGTTGWRLRFVYTPAKNCISLVRLTEQKTN